MIKILNPAAIRISSSTVKRDIVDKFEEKTKYMVAYLKKVTGKISFTIYAWQRLLGVDLDSLSYRSIIGRHAHYNSAECLPYFQNRTTPLPTDYFRM